MSQRGNTLFVGVFMVFMALTVLMIYNIPMERNLSGQQAMSFLKGQVALTDGPYVRSQDEAYFRGKIYSPFPPAPALLMLPFILIFGPQVPIGLLTIPLAILSGWLLLGIYQRMPEQIRLDRWLVIAFVFGTAIWPNVALSEGVWYSAGIVAVFFTTLALFICFGQKRWRGSKAGLALGLAFLSRQMTIFLAPFFILLLWNGISDPFVDDWQTHLRQKLPDLVGFVVFLGLGVLIYLAFNWVRFDNALDSGYNFISNADFTAVRVNTYGLFSSHFVLFNLMYFLFQGFHIAYNGQDMLQIQGVDVFGTSLLVASPFVLAAFYAKLPKPIMWTGGAVILLIVIDDLFYHNNGFAQINSQRFSLDYMPILMLFVGLGVKRLPRSLVKCFVLWATTLNFLAITISFLVGLKQR